MEWQPAETLNWRRTLYASVAAQFLCAAGISFAMPFLAYYLGDLGLKDPLAVRRWAGYMVAGPGFTMAIFAPLWGMLSDRYSRKMMVLRSMGGVVLIMALMGFVRTPGELLALRVIQGALTGTITANMALVSSVTPAERTGYALGMLYAAAHAGNLAGPLAGGFIAEAVGYRAAFWLGSSVVFMAVLLILFYTPDVAATPAMGTGGKPAKHGGRGFRDLFGLSAFVLIIGVMFLVSFASNLALPQFALFVRELLGRQKDAAIITGAIMSLGGVAAVISTGAFSRLGDRVGHVRMLLLCTVGAGIFLALHAAAQEVWHLFVLRFLMGLMTAGILPSANSLLRTVVGAADVGKAFGVAQSTRSLAVGLGGLAGGYLTAQFAGLTGFRVSFLATGVLMLLIPFLVATRLRQRRTE